MSRCIIQGVGEAEPTTGELNRHWLEKEIADVLANAALVIERFNLSKLTIEDRVEFKTKYLRQWHSMEGSAYQPPGCGERIEP